MRFDAIEISDEVLEKIESKHGVTFDEAEEACFSGQRHVRIARDGLYRLFARTDSGRHLLVVLANAGGGVWRLVTAREMTSRERQLYKKSTGE